jgi:hypothetical protein
MGLEQRPNYQQPQFPSLAEEFQRRMAEAGTDDMEELLVAEIKTRYNAFKQSCSSRGEFDAKFLATNKQGEQWLFQRTHLGLDIDDVANKVGVSPWELMFIEMGLPSVDSMLEELRGKLNVLYQGANN